MIGGDSMDNGFSKDVFRNCLKNMTAAH